MNDIFFDYVAFLFVCLLICLFLYIYVIVSSFNISDSIYYAYFVFEEAVEFIPFCQIFLPLGNDCDSLTEAI